MTTPDAGMDVGELDHLHVANANVNGIITLEYSLAVSLKTKPTVTYSPVIVFLYIYPKK